MSLDWWLIFFYSDTLGDKVTHIWFIINISINITIELIFTADWSSPPQMSILRHLTVDIYKKSLITTIIAVDYRYIHSTELSPPTHGYAELQSTQKKCASVLYISQVVPCISGVIPGVSQLFLSRESEDMRSLVSRRL